MAISWSHSLAAVHVYYRQTDTRSKVTTLIFVAILVAGCGAPQPATTWQRRDAPDATLKRDMYECERDTQLRFATDRRGLIFLGAKNADKRAFYERCMEAKGWTRTPAAAAP